MTIVIYVTIILIMSGLCVWALRRPGAPGPFAAKTSDPYLDQAVEEFKAELAKESSDPHRDAFRWRQHYRILAAKFSGNPPVEMTELFFDRLFEQGRDQEDRAA